jgi:hypothetical protein
MKRISILIAYLLLVFAVSFNLWLYRLEPTAKVDPNDNSFQYGLIDRTNSIWDFATKTCIEKNILFFPICHFSYLSDHWVHNWAEGYNLPFYYSHIPQILIVGSYRMIALIPQLHISLFQWYHIIIYLLLCLFPIPVFFALRIIKLPWIFAGIGALLATHISTDGFYGLDPPSFLWRGWGLSSQLFAMIWIPLAIAYSWRWLTNNIKCNISHVKFLYWLEDVKISNLVFFARTKKVYKKENIDNAQTAEQKFFYTSNQNSRRDFWLAVFFTTASVAGHLGIGIITYMSIAVLAFTKTLILILEKKSLWEVIDNCKERFIKLFLLAGTSGFFLSYWIIPILIQNNYHNISWWDPVWKFNSYGWMVIIRWLFNGDLFDWGRPPLFTALVLIGVFVTLLKKNFSNVTPSVSNMQSNTQKNTSNLLRDISSLPYSEFGILFVFWLVMYFGRTTWGGLIDLIPSMEDFHLHRFIVGVHLAGVFLAPIGFAWIIETMVNFLHNVVEKNQKNSTFQVLSTPYAHHIVYICSIIILSLLFIPRIYQQTIYYNELNDRLIIQANDNFDKVKNTTQELFDALHKLPSGRIFAGRGGGWGKDFKVAETPMYMHLSTYGLPTVAWLPETWSLNSDTEQYFSEDVKRTYDLYNIHYVAAPPTQTAQPFWKLLTENPTWKVYEINTPGYIGIGTIPVTVQVNKKNFINVVRNWIQSDLSDKGSYPEIIFNKWTNTPYNKNFTLQHFPMTDEVSYSDVDGKQWNIFDTPLPFNINNPTGTNIGPELVDSEMRYTSTVSVDQGCINCVAFLRATTHPNWNVMVDGKNVKHTNVFPFFPAVPVSPGIHTVTFSYEPALIKVVLITVESLAFIILIIFAFLTKKVHKLSINK